MAAPPTRQARSVCEARRVYAPAVYAGSSNEGLLACEHRCIEQVIRIVVVSVAECSMQGICFTSRAAVAALT